MKSEAKKTRSSARAPGLAFPCIHKLKILSTHVNSTFNATKLDIPTLIDDG